MKDSLLEQFENFEMTENALQQVEGGLTFCADLQDSGATVGCTDSGAYYEDCVDDYGAVGRDRPTGNV